MSRATSSRLAAPSPKRHHAVPSGEPRSSVAQLWPSIRPPLMAMQGHTKIVPRVERARIQEVQHGAGYQKESRYHVPYPRVPTSHTQPARNWLRHHQSGTTRYRSAGPAFRRQNRLRDITRRQPACLRVGHRHPIARGGHHCDNHRCLKPHYSGLSDGPHAGRDPGLRYAGRDPGFA